ncbi:MAG TPA: protein translocase subunit SecF [Acidimicrobiia bacterium]|nr:protein translocase subunit SecF [Acidimicrobiia bacterium]
MSLARRLYHGETHFDFVGRRRWWFGLSAVLMVISALALGLRGLNLSVDFIGGSLIESDNPARASVTDVRTALVGIGLEGAKVQLTGDGSGIRVQTAELTPEAEDRMVAAVAEVVGIDDLDLVSRQTVGPTFGRSVTESAVRALIVFLVVVSLFIWWRLEWRMAAAALVELAHDLLLTAGIYALIGFEVTPATVIAVLTILGYSLYDTVVVFDKIKENIVERGERHTISAIANMSVNQVLMRSINTSLTTLLPVGSLLFVGSYLLGAATLREFALGLFVGIAAGTYSSIFLGAELVAIWKEREEHWQRVRRRLGRKGVEDEFADRTLVAVPDESAEVLAGATGAVPRPPKKRRRQR